jgi:lactate permease
MLKIVLSSAPILIILFMLFVLKQSAWRAGCIGFLCTVLIVLFTPVFDLNMKQLFHPTVEGMLTTSIVAYVLIFGIFLFHLLSESGVINRIATLISNSTQDPIRQVIILAIAFSPLVESSSGFGIAMIVIAPILIALGFDRFKAVLISLVSLSAVPWGTLAMGTVIGANLGDISVHDLGTGSALMSIPTFIYFAFLAVFIAGGWAGIRSRFWEVLGVSLSFGVTVWAMNKYISVELAGIFGALIAITIELLFIRFIHNTPKERMSTINAEVSVTKEASFGVFKTFSPYIFLIVLLLLSRVVPPFKAFLHSSLVITLSEYDFSLPTLYSPGFFLFLTCIFIIISFGINKQMIFKSIRATQKQGTPVIVSTLFFVVMSEIMSTATMTQTLAHAVAGTFGTAFIVISPIIGGLGGFLTGSNTGSNAMFIKLQVQTAQNLGMPPEIVAYGQNTASSHLIMACPSRVLLGATVGNVREKENELLSKITLIGIGTIFIVVLGVLGMYFTST